jgi:hypothetical protein
VHPDDWSEISEAARRRFSDTSAVKGKSRRALRERMPTDVAEWLETFVHEFLRDRPPGHPDALTPGQVATPATMAVYAQAVPGMPADVLLDTLVKLANFAHPGDERAVERLLVHGACLPPSGPPGVDPWQCRWDGAWEALAAVIRKVITPAVWWLGQKVARPDDMPLSEWVRTEANACSVLIRTALVTGCDCWQRWEDFHIKNEALAMAHCARRHDLGVWGGLKPLENFLFRALVQGALFLPNPRTGTRGQARINDFRRGMLAKIAVYDNLVAGPVLRCAHPDCDGEDIDLNDRCTMCRNLAHVHEPSWWLWLKEGKP